MADTLIGRWVQRHRRDKKHSDHQRWHKVESQIGDDVITKCGRRMGREAGGVLADGRRRYGLTDLPAVPVDGRACSFCVVPPVSRPIS